MSDWKTPESPDIFITDMNPVIFSGDPYSFVSAMKNDIKHKPKMLLSTALSLNKNLRADLKNFYKCPIIDIYSSNETGPIAYSCPENPENYHILPNDIYIEIIDKNGWILPEGEIGEIVFTGGRNPFLPLLRYKTGDSASLDFSECSCGEKSPKLTGFSGRQLVIFEDENRNPVNTIDVSRILRGYPVYSHQVVQKKDLSVELNIVPSNLFFQEMEKEILAELEKLFGKNINIIIKKDLKLGDRKIIPYLKEE